MNVGKTTPSSYTSKICNASNSGIALDYTYCFFIAGFLYDSKVTYRELPRDLICVISTIATSISIFNFTFVSEFDQRGVLSFLRSNLEIQRKLRKKKTFFLSDVISLYYYNEFHCLNDLNQQIEFEDSTQMLGKEIEGTLICSRCSSRSFRIDLQHFRLCVTHITISVNHELVEKTSPLNDALPFSFKGCVFGGFVGEWKDIKVIGVTIRTEEKRDVNGKQYRRVARTWKFKSNVYFRYFRLPCYIIRKNVFQCAFSGVELYGKLIIDNLF
jgi:hypothetical protein